MEKDIKGLAVKLRDMFVDKLPYFSRNDLKAMRRTFSDMQYGKAFKNEGVDINETDDDMEYFEGISSLLVDDSKFEPSFGVARLLEMVAIERAIINARFVYKLL